jgi:ferric-dicitrate binding protein FerR (iron transport regulator)
MKQNKDISAIIFKVLVGDASNEERKYLTQWRRTSYENEALFQRIVDSKGIVDAFDVYSKIDLEKAFRRIIPRKNEQSKLLIPVWLRYSAAIIVVTLVTGLLVYLNTNQNQVTDIYLGMSPGSSKAILVIDDETQYVLEDLAFKEIKSNELVLINDGKSLSYDKVEESNNEKSVEMHTLSVPRGGEYKLVLSDGTSIWVNSESTLKFPANFTGTEREVELFGEAYFEVAPNTQMPFIVKTGEIKVKVVGTEFNIKSYDNESDITTSLLNGQVLVSCNDVTVEEHVLQPGEQASFNKTKKEIQISEADVFAASSWRHGRFVLRHETLGNIMNVISRWYDVNVTYTNSDLQTLLFNVNTFKYSDVGEMLAAIEKTGKVRFERHQNIIIVKEY